MWGSTAHPKKLERGCRMIYAGLPCCFGSGLEDGDVPTFCLPLEESGLKKPKEGASWFNTW